MRPTRRLLLSLTGAALAARMADAANPPPPPPPPAIPGAALPLSGTLALIGDEALRGITLAADVVNAAGGIAGKPLALVTQDAPEQGSAGGAVNQLITQDHAALVLSAGDSDLSYPASAAAELAQVPFIELTTAADGITRRGFRYLLHTGPATSSVAALAVATLARDTATEKIGLLFNTGATAGATAAAVLAGLKTAKIPVRLAIGYAKDEADFYDIAGRLKRAGVEMLLHAAGPSDALAFYAALREQDWRPPALLGCGDGYLLRENAYALGEALEGTKVIGAPYYPPGAAALEAAYFAKYGMAPRAPASLSAYAGAKLVFDALNAVNGNASKLLDNLRKTDIALGGLVNGWGVAFGHDGQNTRSFVVLQQWQGGALRPVAGGKK